MEAVEVISAVIEEFVSKTDEEVLASLVELAPLADEDDRCWEDDEYWRDVDYRYIGFAKIAGNRKMNAAIQPLLERACNGDPGEIMRGLRHSLEKIVNPNWDELATICLETARSERPGTRLWSIDQLRILRDPRAKAIFEDALQSDSEELRWRAEDGLERITEAEE